MEPDVVSTSQIIQSALSVDSGQKKNTRVRLGDIRVLGELQLTIRK